MSKFLKAFVIFSVLTASQVANAGLITFNTKSLDQATLTDDLKTSWDLNGNSIIHRDDVDSFEQFKIGRSKIGHINISFDLDQVGYWTLDFGLDAGLGAEIWVDGLLVVDRTDDLWWAGNWNHSDVVSMINQEFSVGFHSIDLYFAEVCCDGPSSILFTDNATQQVAFLSNDVLPQASVPEPASAALLALGALGLMVRRKAK